MRQLIKGRSTGNRARLVSLEGPLMVVYRSSRRSISEEIGVNTQILPEPITSMLGI